MLILDKMWSRVEIAKQDSDTSLFLNLLYTGEMITKLLTAGLVAAIRDERERHKYSQIHKLVRADSLGIWVQTLDDVLTGPPSQYLHPGVENIRLQINQKVPFGNWQYETFDKLNRTFRTIHSKASDTPPKANLRNWFQTFVALRNKSRGHGATMSSKCSQVCPDLQCSLRILSERLSLFSFPWVHLYRNLSGKYRVIHISGETSPFDNLKTSSYARSKNSINYEDGIYLYLGEPILVELIKANPDVTDFYFPNGAFNKATFELRSYISDDCIEGDSSSYLKPASQLPRSETEGLPTLDGKKEVFTNIPPNIKNYISRPALEDELLEVLKDDRHPIITLLGRGGIGKTSLALAALHKIAEEGVYPIILWFSARDIDLLPTGPKTVKPHVLTIEDIAHEYTSLIGNPDKSTEKDFDENAFLASSMTKSPIDEPILFVLDNFETVRNPVDLFRWIDSHIRLPNKVLITTRYREFKADYPIEVIGMMEKEAHNLIENTARQLGVNELLTEKYCADLYNESDGHPYIIKVLLGEVAKAKKMVKVERIVASRDEMLDALFERTYSGLSPVGKRIFLTLCKWCVFRTKPATHSGAKWPPIPIQIGHPFRSKTATCSGKTGHLFRQNRPP